MRAAEYLGQIRRLDAKINNKLTERQRIMELATRITPSMSDMPRASGVSDKVGDAVLKLVALEEEINQTIDQLIDIRAEVVKLLEALPHDEYTVLHHYYVQGQTVESIADVMTPRPKTPRQIYRIKARAMRRVQSILDAREGGQ